MLYILALPFLLFLSTKQKYRISIPARFFLKNNPSFSKTDGFYFHVCSLGEAKALKPILEKLDQKIAISTITQTGNEEAKKYDADVRYLPYEMFLPFWLKKQKVLVVFEAEFWYMLFLVMKKKYNAKIVLLNARISDRSAKKYQKFAWFYKKIFANVDLVFAQNESDKKRLQNLGAKNIEVVGNIKLSQKIIKTKEYEKPLSEIITAASTHEDEEKLILEAFLKYKKINQNSKLIVVPRHPERFDSVYELLDKSGLSVSCFSKDKSFNSDIILVDMMGELNNIYAITDIAILGGAFRDDVGGHNPLEPAFFGCKVISGEHFFHQKALFKEVKNIKVIKNNELFDTLKNSSKLQKASYDSNVDLEKILF